MTNIKHVLADKQNNKFKFSWHVFLFTWYIFTNNLVKRKPCRRINSWHALTRSIGKSELWTTFYWDSNTKPASLQLVDIVKYAPSWTMMYVEIGHCCRVISRLYWEGWVGKLYYISAIILVQTNISKCFIVIILHPIITISIPL